MFIFPALYKDKSLANLKKPFSSGVHTGIATTDWKLKLLIQIFCLGYDLILPGG